MNTIPPAQRCCENCCYRMRSETSTTGFRCGYEHYMTAPLLRKFKTMSQYPVVRPYTICEMWSPLTTDSLTDAVRH